MKEQIEKLIQMYKNKLKNKNFSNLERITTYDMGRAEEIDTIIEHLEAILKIG
jgi:hypothetical protein